MNQTMMGLKHEVVAELRKISNKGESDHDGIETGYRHGVRLDDQ